MKLSKVKFAAPVDHPSVGGPHAPAMGKLFTQSKFELEVIDGWVHVRADNVVRIVPVCNVEWADPLPAPAPEEQPVSKGKSK